MLKKFFYFTVLCLFIAGASSFLLYESKDADAEIQEITQKTDLKQGDNEKNPEKLLFNLNLNETYYDLVIASGGELGKGNANKFGGDIKKSSINISVDNMELVEENENKKLYNANTSGVIKSPTGNFNFSGKGEIYKVKLSTGDWVYSGSFEGDFKNKATNETFTISMRHNIDSGEVDVVFVSGVLGDTGVLPFGKPFLLDDKIIEIEETIRQVDESEVNAS
ncbi:hypothetical protein ACQKDD_17840 [Planococcus kocurii]|uniref:hypothetical protein n=1 Tax=Planococcus TaxID=1372 RepID=UPI0011EF04C5|nr:hypothetical protein [Planococcus sp. ANT_H30]KAA0957598.1 hypothetical protein FQ085_05945 [Planococcus sp. ANT_H30]